MLYARAGGYLLEVIAPDDPAVHAAIESFAIAELGATPVDGSQLGRAQFRLAPDGPSLSAVFRALESVKHRLQVCSSIETVMRRIRADSGGS